ncbi:MAG TPA: hypothetical protein VFW83_10470 [Bryobacteraceae bacterium]|nr:hypothetical protein [Bryobacteraceae bacterium]
MVIATADDARLLFSKWTEAEASLRIKLFSSWLMLDAVGVITAFNPTSVQCSGESWNMTIPVAGAEYSFSDPRESPVASVRESEASRYEFGLSIDLPNQDRLVILELKPAPAEEADIDGEPQF